MPPPYLMLPEPLAFVGVFPRQRIVHAPGDYHSLVAIVTTPTRFHGFGIVALIPARVDARGDRATADYAVHITASCGMMGGGRLPPPR
jgi:hypothetical protein